MKQNPEVIECGLASAVPYRFYDDETRDWRVFYDNIIVTHIRANIENCRSTLDGLVNTASIVRTKTRMQIRDSI